MGFVKIIFRETRDVTREKFKKSHRLIPLSEIKNK